MKQYHHQSRLGSHYFVVEDPDSGYKLMVDLYHQGMPESMVSSCLEVMFKIESPSGLYFLVTGRDFDKYENFYSLKDVSPGMNIMEVGAGLGGLIPALAEKFKGESRPKVIDPADYGLMREMLEIAKAANLGPRYNSILAKFIERCDVITNPEQVELFNTTIGEALAHHSHLRGTFDVVVDHCGASTYPFTEKNIPDDDEAIHVIGLEKELLKPDGALYLV